MAGLTGRGSLGVMSVSPIEPAVIGVDVHEHLVRVIVASDELVSFSLARVPGAVASVAREAAAGPVCAIGWTPLGSSISYEFISLSGAAWSPGRALRRDASPPPRLASGHSRGEETDVHVGSGGREARGDACRHRGVAGGLLHGTVFR